MTKQREHPAKTWYDFYDDWDLIEASIAQQYGVRIRDEINTISWREVCVLIGGLLPETPLGRIIQIRSETDKEMLKNFTPEMRKIRADWLSKMAKDNVKQYSDEQLDNIFKNMEEGFKVLFS